MAPVFNPRAEIWTRREADEITAVTVTAPVRGRGLQVVECRASEGERFGRLRRVMVRAFWEADAGRARVFWEGASDEDRDALASAGVFVEPDEIPRELAPPEALAADLASYDAWIREQAQTIDRAAATFARDGAVALPALLPPPAVETLRRYYRDFLAEGYAIRGDGRGARDVRYTDAVARLWHPPLSAVVGGVAGMAIKPSFSYLVSYATGDALARHTDRAQCEVVASVQIDFVPEPEGAVPWPIYCFPEGRPAIRLDLPLGGAAIFRGRVVPHARGPLVDGDRSTLLTFCFVGADFTGTLA